VKALGMVSLVSPLRILRKAGGGRRIQVTAGQLSAIHLRALGP